MIPAPLLLPHLSLLHLLSVGKRLRLSEEEEEEEEGGEEEEEEEQCVAESPCALLVVEDEECLHLPAGEAGAELFRIGEPR